MANLAVRNSGEWTMLNFLYRFCYFKVVPIGTVDFIIKIEDKIDNGFERYLWELKNLKGLICKYNV